MAHPLLAWSRIVFRRMGLRLGASIVLAALLWLKQRAALRLKRQAWAQETRRLAEQRRCGASPCTVAARLCSAGAPAPSPPRPSICFQGAGCLVMYHVGVARYVQEHFANVAEASVYGCSSGALVASCLAAGLDLGSHSLVAQQCVEKTRR